MTALALGVALGLPAAAGEPTATELVDRANELLRGSSSFARVTMTVETPSWKRELSIESWHKGRGLALVVVRSPPKDRGTATLRVGSQMWTWMPSVERVIKVPPTMMHSAWMGSDFTYEDMVKADSIVKDYTHRIVERVKAEGGATLGVIEALPREEAPVVWGRVLFRLREEPDGSVLPEGEEDFNERGERVRTIVLSRVREMDGRRLPTRMECVSNRKKGRRTVVEYHEIDFDVPLEDSFFSLDRLQKGGR